MKKYGERKTQRNGNDDIDLLDIVRILWCNLGRIILMGLICSIVVLLITIFLIQPTYRARFSVYVNNRNAAGTADTLGSSDIIASQSLAKTYAKIILSRPVVEAAMERSNTNKSYDYESIKNGVSSSVEEDTQLVNVSVVMASPEDAYNLANAIAEVAPDYVAEVVEGSSMKVVTSPVLPTKQYTPRPRKNVIIAMTIGMLIMAIYIVIRNLTDNRVKSDIDLEERYGIFIIGTIPNFFEKDNSGYGRYYSQTTDKNKG